MKQADNQLNIDAIVKHLHRGQIPQLVQLFSTLSQADIAQVHTLLTQHISPAASSVIGRLLQNQPSLSFDRQTEQLCSGILYLEIGCPVEAERCLRNTISDRQTVDGYRFHAMALGMLGQTDAALNSYNNAISLYPKTAELYFERARVLHILGQIQHAIEDYQVACNLAPKNPDCWLELGNACQASAQNDRALDAYTNAIEIFPRFAEAYNNRAIVYKAVGRLQDAVTDFDQALAANPRHLYAYLNRGALLSDLNQLQAASKDFERALAIAPHDGHAHYGLGEVLHRLGEHEPAIHCFDAAILLDQKMPKAYLSKGNALQSLNRFDAAIEAYAAAIDTDPDFIDAYVNWGTALQEQCRHEEAIAIFDKVLAIRPDYAGANWNKANSMLCLSLEIESWREYEKRHIVQAADKDLQYCHPLLVENPWHGKRLLLHWDQRYGDIIHALRYVLQVEEMAGSCVWQIAPALKELVAVSFPDIHIVEPDDFKHDVDYTLPITSLPLAMGTFDESLIPRQVPYLRPSPDKLEQWATVLPEGKPNVGLTWRGQAVPPGRSIELEQLLPLLQIEDISLCAVQLGITDKERVLLQKYQVHNFEEKLNTFNDTAALLEQLDLLITIDTSVAHLGGALGIPTWVMLKYGGDWRWHLTGSESAWYPNVQIFRQCRISDWTDVVRDVVNMSKNGGVSYYRQKDRE